MAACADDWWIVVIIADDANHHLIYNLPVSTTIKEVLGIWKLDLGVLGHWAMTSVDGSTQYDIDLPLEAIGEIVPGAKMINMRVKSIILERHRANVFVLDDDQSNVRSVNLNLDESLGSFVKWRGVFEHEGTLVSLCSSFKNIEVKDQGVIYKTCTIPVQLSDNKSVVVIKVVESGTVQDLKNRLTQYESGCFCLKFMGRVIHPQEPIKGLICSGRRRVEVYRPTITVRLADRKVSWPVDVEDLRYGDLLTQLFINSDVKPDVLENISFRCFGCGRRVWSDEEGFQKIMSDCCRVQSLDLEEIPSIKDENIQTGYQASWSITDQQYDILDSPLPFRYWAGRIAGVRRFRNRMTQFEFTEAESAEKAPILIHGYTGREIVYAKLMVSVPLTTNCLRNEIHKLWQWNPENVLLYRRNGIRRLDGSKCVHVCDENDEWRWGNKADYFSTTGFPSNHLEVDREWSWNCEMLLENSAIPLLGTIRNVISAEQRQTPLVPMSIYIRNKILHGKDFIIDLRTETDVFKTRHLRYAIAEQLKTDCEKLKLHWRSGSVQGKPCLHVCDKEGRFVDGDSENAVFVNEERETFTPPEVQDAHLKVFESQYNFWDKPFRIMLKVGKEHRFVLIVTLVEDVKDSSVTI